MSGLKIGPGIPLRSLRGARYVTPAVALFAVPGYIMMTTTNLFSDDVLDAMPPPPVTPGGGHQGLNQAQGTRHARIQPGDSLQATLGQARAARDGE